MKSKFHQFCHSGRSPLGKGLPTGEAGLSLSGIFLTFHSGLKYKIKKIEGIITIHSKNKEQKDALKSLFKVMNIPFEEERKKSTYDPWVC
ncbi:MAG: hypothetical protein EPN39_17200 [Chitinophagaceae bacterium]|jgi:hypothetical protein|nr:MAG: hypothetical protein EPN39_17200 [Chitinophagaceae bacterium]